MATTVFVDGQEGTTGLRVHEYLAARQDVEVLRIDPDKRQERLNAHDCSTPPASPSCACPTPPRARPRRW